VGAIVGLGEACARLLELDRGALERQLRERRDRFEARLLEAIPGARIAARASARLPQTTSLLLPGLRSEDVLVALDLAGIHASAGSACSSGALEPSHVLAAMGVPPELARGVVRLSFGEGTSERELETAASELAAIARRMREGSHGTR
jgi:cysteine desulfurase